MSHSRRNLLRALSVGGVVGATQLPTSWSKPVVDAVVLPAHAQTTGGFFGAGVAQTIVMQPSPEDLNPGRIAGFLGQTVDGLVGEARANVHMEILWPVFAGPETYEATLDASGNLTIRLESFSALNIPLQGSNERPLSGLIADAHAGTPQQQPMQWVTEEPPQGCYTGFIDAGDFRPLTGVTCSPFGPASGRIVSSTPEQIDGELRLDNFRGLVIGFSVFPGAGTVDCSGCVEPELVLCEDQCLRE
jgi:hypothetical protein